MSDQLQQFVKEQERNKQLCSSAPQKHTASTSAAKHNNRSSRKRQNSKGPRGPRAKGGKKVGPSGGDQGATGAPEDLNQAAGSSSHTLTETEEEETAADGDSQDPAQGGVSFSFLLLL